MDLSLRPRRSKTSRQPLSPLGKPSVPSISAVSPCRASSLLRGSVKSLAIGTLGSVGTEGSTIHEESVAEVTVSLSRSSCFSSKSPRQSTPIRMGDDAESQDTSTAKDSYAQFLDSYQHHQPLGMGDDVSFTDPYLDFSTRRSKIPNLRHGLIIEEPLDDFMTAYTSPENVAVEFDILLSPKPLKITKGQVVSRPPTSDPDSNKRILRDRQERNYWRTVVTNRTVALGTLHRQTAEAFLSLGHAHMRLGEFHEAMSAFQSCCKISQDLDGPTHLSVGRALDAFGLAALRCKQGGASYLIQAKAALEEAFAIRFHSLGVWHVDTVETFNKIASVYLHLGRLEEAREAYKEVYLVRKAIYGANHPSVAISAHGLANVYLKLKKYEESLRFFQVAITVYQNMRLPKNHPTVTRLLNDRKRLEYI